MPFQSQAQTSTPLLTKKLRYEKSQKRKTIKLNHSAEGAKDGSQGQALSRAKRVAPGSIDNDAAALKERKKSLNRISICRTFSARFKFLRLTRGDALRSAQRLPLATIFRAFGAGHTEFDFQAEP